jgi:hypothetical protein
MTFKPKIWYPIAVVLSAVNVVGIAFVGAGPMAPWHAVTHGALAVAFGLWAQRLRQRRDQGELQTPVEGVEGAGGLEALEDEVNRLRQELTETQERLDFTERILARKPDSRPPV